MNLFIQEAVKGHIHGEAAEVAASVPGFQGQENREWEKGLHLRACACAAASTCINVRDFCVCFPPLYQVEPCAGVSFGHHRDAHEALDLPRRLVVSAGRENTQWMRGDTEVRKHMHLQCIFKNRYDRFREKGFAPGRGENRENAVRKTASRPTLKNEKSIKE